MAAVALFAGIAAVVVWGVLRTPALVARLVPASVERRMGELTVGDFGCRGCQAPAGRAELDTLVRQLGLSVLLGGSDGNADGYTNALLSAAYSRRAETRADRYAQERLRAAAVSPAATAAFFRRLGKSGDRAERLFAYVGSHPVSVDRARAFAASGATGATYRPALDATQWAALKDICKGRSERFEWRF